MARKKIGSKKSKRISCGKRYKIEKKIKEHLKKVNKTKENKIKKGIRGNRKEITVPNNCPFKEDILKKAQEAKERKEQERQKQKEMQKKNRDKLVNQKRNLESIVKDAEKRAAAYEKKNEFVKEKAEKLGGKINVESSLKTFYKEVKNVIERSDVIIEVLDARDPLGSRCRQLEETVISCAKKLILLVNKIDLVPKENVEAWLKYLRRELPALPFKACTQQQTDRLGITKVSALLDKDNIKKTSTCLGSDMLLSLLNNYCRSKDIKTSITIGIVGFPNTGKSSIINSLKRSKACNVGSTPGVTKAMQVVQLDKHIKLIDSPGVVMATNLESEEEVILKNCVRIENLEDPVSVVQVIMSKCNKFQLMAIYALPEFNDLDQFLELLAKRFGLLKKGGRPDLNKASKIVIRDWNGGKITYYSKPPEDSATLGHLSTEVTQEMKAAFDIDALFETETQIIKGLKKGANNMDSVLSSGKVAEGQIQYAEEVVDEDMDDDDDDNDEEEEEEEDDGEDNMDTSAAVEPAQQTVVKVEAKKVKSRSKEEEKKVTFQDQLPGNQQLNKARKQQFKQLLKKRKRAGKISDSLSSALMSSLGSV